MAINSQMPKIKAVIEIPRGSFLKRGWNGSIDFVSPFPCPFNYGSIPDYIGGEGDLLDAVVLGPRIPRMKHSSDGTRIRVTIDDYGHETHEKTRKIIFILVQLTGFSGLH